MTENSSDASDWNALSEFGLQSANERIGHEKASLKTEGTSAMLIQNLCSKVLSTLFLTLPGILVLTGCTGIHDPVENGESAPGHAVVSPLSPAPQFPTPAEVAARIRSIPAPRSVETMTQVFGEPRSTFPSYQFVLAGQGRERLTMLCNFIQGNQGLQTFLYNPYNLAIFAVHQSDPELSGRTDEPWNAPTDGTYMTAWTQVGCCCAVYRIDPRRVIDLTPGVQKIEPDGTDMGSVIALNREKAEELRRFLDQNPKGIFLLMGRNEFIQFFRADQFTGHGNLQVMANPYADGAEIFIRTQALARGATPYTPDSFTLRLRRFHEVGRVSTFFEPKRNQD